MRHNEGPAQGRFQPDVVSDRAMGRAAAYLQPAWQHMRRLRLAMAAALAFQVLAPAGWAAIGLGNQAKAVSSAAGAALQAVFPEPVRREKPPHLIGFYAEQSMEAKRMRYLGDLLEQELPGTKILWLEAWENPLNERLRATIDLRNQCGGVPYLFNRKTGKVLCGVVHYDKLRLWAQGLGGDARIYRDIGGN